jgi:2-polyprenyl-3-methyl-5-hydroxy-6-metoxy-1,4-benzoquinol methylase
MDQRGAYQYFEDVNWGVLRLWNSRRGLDVLDVGCGFASTSEYVAKLGNRVVGIEESAAAAAVARERIAEVVEADLQKSDAVRHAIGERRFDTIIFADVLEHLPWPAGVLRDYLTFLNDSGTVIISVPNVGLWSVRLSIMAGRFQYQDTGVLDRTHLCFFTRRSAVQMIETAGLETIRRTYNPGLVRPFVPLAKKLLAPKSDEGESDPAALLNSRPYRAYLKAVYPVERLIARAWPGALAFQMIFEARRNR